LIICLYNVIYLCHSLGYTVPFTMAVLENITLMYVLCHSTYINVIFLCEWPNCVDVPLRN